MRSEWIRLNNWKKVQFTDVCSFSGLPTGTCKEYTFFNTSLIWRILGVLQWGQYIDLNVPFSQEGLDQIKKLRKKAIIKGLLIGSVFSILGFIIGVYISVEAETKFIKNLGIIIGGCTFLFSLILVPVVALYILHLKTSPLYFRKKNKELWVKIRNNDYRKKFNILNDFMMISSGNVHDSDILDKE